MARNWKYDWNSKDHRDALPNRSFEAGMRLLVRVCASVCIGLMGTSVCVAQTQTTEHVARDNEVINTLEIKAFGQIRDMETWRKSLNDRGLLSANQSISVTGYSLGGLLATAFNMLHASETTLHGDPAKEAHADYVRGSVISPSANSSNWRVAA